MADQAKPVAETRDPSSGAGDDPRIIEAVKEYLTLLEVGQGSRDTFLAKHPEIADELAAYLDGLEIVHGAAVEARVAANSLSMSAGAPPELADYRILREIGRGGMGVVYEALHVPLARRVALKVLPLVSAFDPMRLRRFKSEAQAVARLQHPNIVQVYGVGSERDVHFYAMQLIDGYSLSAAISQCRRAHGKSREADEDGSRSLSEADENGEANLQLRPAFTRDAAGESTDRDAHRGTRPTGAGAKWGEHDGGDSGVHSLASLYDRRHDYYREVVRLVREAALALEHAHQSGVIHRDVKPANLLVDRTAHLWVADFGLARVASDAEMTQTGTPLGTLRYMSPEQAAGDRGLIDHRTDIYSLGVTLYELLTLEPAVPGENSHTLLRKVIEEDPLSPRKLDGRIPVDLETIVLKSAAKTPAERYASAQALADDLQRWLDERPILARPPNVWERATKWQRRHRTFVKWAAGFAALAVCGLLVANAMIANAYRREASVRRAAEASFLQARRAVDAFSELGETELAAKPELRDVRRRLLDLALGYYREFEAEHKDDPAVATEMASTSERISRIVDEMKSLDDSAPLLLVSHVRVQDDVKLDEKQREQVRAFLVQFSAARAKSEKDSTLSAANAQHHLAELLQTYEDQISHVITPEQAERLRQIARQQRAPFVFRSPEVITALAATPEQLQQVNAIIEENRIDGGGRQPMNRRGGPRDDRGPPGGFDDRGPPPEFGGPPPDDDFGGPPPPPPRGGRPPGPPPDDDFGRGGPGGPPGGPGRFAEASKATTAKILAMLTPEQRAAWERLVGTPFKGDLHWGPDDLLPH